MIFFWDRSILNLTKSHSKNTYTPGDSMPEANAVEATHRTRRNGGRKESKSEKRM